MKAATGILARMVLSVAILGTLVFFISPRKVLEALSACNWRWLLATILLMPLFLVVRVAKWFILVRQMDPNVDLGNVIRGYLWGMAVGMVSPGRIGELARIWAAGLPTNYVGLFLLEKMIEISCVFGLSLISIASIGFCPLWVSFILFIFFVFFLLSWRWFMKSIAHLIHQILKWPSQNMLEEFNQSISRLKVVNCSILSLFVLIIFCLQCYLMLNSMGERYDIIVMRFIPVIFLANLVPITIGGLGLRETVAIFLLSNEGIPAAVIMISFFLVTIVDLFIPAVVGAIVYAFTPRARNRCKNMNV